MDNFRLGMIMERPFKYFSCGNYPFSDSLLVFVGSRGVQAGGCRDGGSGAGTDWLAAYWG